MTKICTSIKQSKKLIELGIPKNTADMRIGNYVGKSNKVDGTNVHYYTKEESFGAPEIIPAWSLSALLELMPIECKLEKTLLDQSDYFTYACEWTGEYRTYEHDDSLDAAFEMVVWLKENNTI